MAPNGVRWFASWGVEISSGSSRWRLGPRADAVPVHGEIRRFCRRTGVGSHRVSRRPHVRRSLRESPSKTGEPKDLGFRDLGTQGAACQGRHRAGTTTVPRTTRWQSAVPFRSTSSWSTAAGTRRSCKWSGGSSPLPTLSRTRCRCRADAPPRGVNRVQRHSVPREPRCELSDYMHGLGLLAPRPPCTATAPRCPKRPFPARSC